MVKIDKENSLFITGVVIANGVADSDGDVLTKKEIKQLNKEKQDSIKNAQQAVGSLPDYMKQSDSDD